MEEDMDVVVFEDEEGNQIEYEIEFTFEHKGEEYAVLSEVTDRELGEDEFPELYILKVVKNDGKEEFVAAEEEKMDELIGVVESILADEIEGCSTEGCEGCHGCDH